jgi:hypothetical protein
MVGVGLATPIRVILLALNMTKQPCGDHIGWRIVDTTRESDMKLICLYSDYYQIDSINYAVLASFID